MDERAVNCVKAALKWIKAHNVCWSSTEQKCYSKKHNCSGTMDGMALVDSCNDPTCCRVAFKDHLSLIDWKSSNYLYSEYLFQTAAYEGFHMEEFPNVHILDRWIIRLGKDDAEFDPWYLPAETFADDYAGFLACLALKRLVISAEERLKVQKQGVRAAKKAAKDSAREIAKATEKAEKAIKKAEARILKEEQKARVKQEAKIAREAARAEGKRLKEEVKNAPKAPAPVPVPLQEAVVNALADARLSGFDTTKVNPELTRLLAQATKEHQEVLEMPATPSFIIPMDED